MTLCAGDVCMCAFEFKEIGIMVEVTKAVYAVVAGDAVGAE
ncbi:MAG: hypothetical protein Fur0017_12630 [Anaerolineales bacterium]